MNNWVRKSVTTAVILGMLFAIFSSAAYAWTWGVERVRAPDAWSIGYTGFGVKVCVIDSGIDKTHSNLKYMDGKSFVDYTTDFQDDFGHGTFVAGIIAGQGLNGVKGVAPDAQLYIAKVLDNQNRFSNGQIIIDAIAWCEANHVNIINMSLYIDDQSDAIDHAITEAYNQGISVVVAGGNNGTSDTTANTTNYIARNPHEIAVAATDNENNRGHFSATGPELFIAAPGVQDYSTMWISGRTNQYGYWDGTSFATPHVTGLLALYKQQFTRATPDQLKKYIENSALDLGTAGKDSLFGYGLAQYAPYADNKISIVGHKLRKLRQ
jgi:minor extracellular protease Epr